jgi:hypothetical protein
MYHTGATMRSISSNPKSAALASSVLILPLLILNSIAGNQLEPLYSIFKVNTGGGFWDHPIGHISLVIALLLLPVGAVIAMRPMLHTGADARRQFYLINGVLALLMLALFFLISGALLEEMYRCNVLQIPNCD